jgi:hypothetical protein
MSYPRKSWVHLLQNVSVKVTIPLFPFTLKRLIISSHLIGHTLGECSQFVVQHCLDRWLIKFPKPSAPFEITDNTSVIIIDLTTI